MLNVQSVQYQFHSYTHELLRVPVHAASAFPILSACGTFPIVTVLTKCLSLTNISKITSSSARLIDTTVASLLLGWFAVFVVLTKTLQSITQAKIYTLQNVRLPRLEWHNLVKCCDNLI